jgi:heme oxygenase
MTPERLDRLNKSAFKTVEEAAEKYKDIKILWEDYKSLEKKGTFSEEFLKGYFSSISDLIIIKKML